jgi:hypothetical protein
MNTVSIILYEMQLCVILGKTGEHKNVLTTLDSTVLHFTTDTVTKQNLYTSTYITVVTIIIDLITLLSIYVLRNLHLSQMIIIIIIFLI